MKVCTKCNVKIIDDTDRCPLCRHALSGTEKGENTYPDALTGIRKARMVENIILFASIVLSVAAIAVNLMIGHQLWWSIIATLGLLYGNLILRYAVMGRADYQEKTFGMFVIAILILVGIDYLTGFQGWALTYVYPGAIVLVDIGILILMLVNRRNWQSYIMAQIIMIMLSLISIVFILFRLTHFPLISMIATAFSIFCLVGTLILGENRARNEIKRRFHIK